MQRTWKDSGLTYHPSFFDTVSSYSPWKGENGNKRVQCRRWGGRRIPADCTPSTPGELHRKSREKRRYRRNSGSFQLHFAVESGENTYFSIP